jgi:hypothetical protein
MTIETQTFVRPQDIKSLRFQCKCGVKLSIPVSEGFKSDLLQVGQCPHCKEGWFQGDRDNLFTTISSLVTYLDALNQVSHAKFEVTFELSNSAAPASHAGA